MPDPSLSPAIIEARAVCPSNVFEIETLEVSHPALTRATKNLQLCFVVDNTGSQDANIALIRTVLGEVSALIASEFETITYSLIQFKDEDETTKVTGENFVDLETIQTAINALSSGGGGDGPENGYGAAVLASSLPWSDENGFAKAVFLITDRESHKRGATQSEAIAALVAEGVNFSYGFTTANVASFQPLADATGGIRITSEVSETISQELSDLLKNLVVVGGNQLPLYLVNDTRPHSLPLKAGQEPVDFLVRGFKTRLTGSGQNGLQNLSITIDDVDRKVSQFIRRAKDFPSPIELTLRVYLSDDLTRPQNDPPTVLFLTSAKKTDDGLSCTASTIDVVNAPFPNAYYRLENFPLQ